LEEQHLVFVPYIKKKKSQNTCRWRDKKEKKEKKTKKEAHTPFDSHQQK
jgi:hypothetical protein